VSERTAAQRPVAPSSVVTKETARGPGKCRCGRRSSARQLRIGNKQDLGSAKAVLKWRIIR